MTAAMTALGHASFHFPFLRAATADANNSRITAVRSGTPCLSAMIPSTASSRLSGNLMAICFIGCPSSRGLPRGLDIFPIVKIVSHPNKPHKITK